MYSVPREVEISERFKNSLDRVQKSRLNLKDLNKKDEMEIKGKRWHQNDRIDAQLH